MKKTVLMLVASFTAVALLFGATALIARNISFSENTEEEIQSSELYEVVKFVEPEKTQYYLSDVKTIPLTSNKDEKRFVQGIEFDGTGMSITVKNKETGKEKTYKYTCRYFELDGELVKEEENIHFVFEPEVNQKLTEGEYTADVYLVTDDDETVVHKMPFTIVKDPEETQAPTVAPTEKETTAETQPPTEQEVEEKNEPQQDEYEDTPVEEEQTPDEIVIADVTRQWNHLNNPSGAYLTVTAQNGNTIWISIVCVKENGSQIASTDVMVELDDVYFDGVVVRGNGTFTYVDSFSNSGTGYISVSDNVIHLDITETENAGRGFGITGATGKYI